jgi:hypothetical protein
MPVDLTNILPPSPRFHDPHEWTPEKLRDQLNKWGIQYQWADGKAKLTTCLFCRQVEGRPAFGVTEGNPWYNCQRANKCGARWPDVLARFGQTGEAKGLPILRLSDLPEKYPKPRETIVEGLLRRGDQANVIGGPKSRKSFFVLLLAISVGLGIPFLGMPTTRSRVLLIDNELHPGDLARRAERMADAMGVSLADAGVEVMPLRGKLADLHVIKRELSRLPPQTYSMILLDALYKSLPAGTNENDNGEMTAAFVLIDSICESHECASLIVHHLSKGQQAHKSVSDCGAGAGAQSRSADVHVVLRDHVDENTVVLEAILRSLPPIDPLCLEFRYPLWHVVDKNPEHLAVPGKKRTATVDEFIETVPTEPTRKKVVLAKSKAKLELSRAAIDVLCAEAIERGLIVEDIPTNKSHPHLIARAKV